MVKTACGSIGIACFTPNKALCLIT
ncbi:DUF3265 domain-containing protein [Vibrio alginolyticus]|nr:DUF3265 domain-containing protein [Vibrio alginolyticus]MDN8587035.1 DUF3265 domain-containing protein [Vibrio alginolyticus]WED61296.1 DUF3265 domain-containing protein [Vibrio alginolyticus]